MVLDPSATHQTYAQCITTGTLALIAVILRFIARFKSRAGFGADDYFALFALCIFWAYNIVTIWSTSLGGAGIFVSDMPQPIVIPTLKAFYVNVILTIVTISSAKLSVLCLYHRIFGVSRTFRMALMVVGFVSVAWCISCIMAAAFKCNPVRGSWDPWVRSHCYSLNLVFVITESINCLTDLVIVLLPVFMLRKLQMRLSQKIGVSLIFLLGGFVVLTSILRIVYNYKPSNPKYALIASNLWIVLQLSCAIICACLPVYRPIMPELPTVFKTRIASLSSLLGRHSSMSSRHHHRPASVKIHGSEKMIPQPVPTFRARYEGYEEYTDISDQVALAGLPSGKGQYGGKQGAPPQEVKIKNMV